MAIKLLEVGIGLGMMYLLLAMLVTGVVELWAAAWDKRARVLANGMKAMYEGKPQPIFRPFTRPCS